MAAFGWGVLYLVRAATHVGERLHADREQARHPQKVISDRVELRNGQSLRYALRVAGPSEVRIDVRSTPAAVTVLFVATRDGAQPLWRHEEAVVLTKTQMVARGEWTIVIEPTHKTTLAARLTTVVTEVTVE